MTKKTAHTLSYEFLVYHVPERVTASNYYHSTVLTMLIITYIQLFLQIVRHFGIEMWNGLTTVSTNLKACGVCLLVACRVRGGACGAMLLVACRSTFLFAVSGGVGRPGSCVRE